MNEILQEARGKLVETVDLFIKEAEASMRDYPQEYAETGVEDIILYFWETGYNY
jgi:hypothetical protein